jgi:hypothetical protein
MTTTVSKRNGKTKKAYSARAAINALASQAGRMDIVPYAGTVARGAKMGLEAYDAISQLMSHFRSSQRPGVAGGPASLVAGVSNNVQVTRSQPKYVYSQGSVRIVHKELVCNVVNSTGIQSTISTVSGSSVYQVNAGSGNAFPWLSQIAANYDRYRFKRLRLVYVPLCPTTEAGRVTMCYDVDSTDPIPLDRQSISNYHCSSEGAPWATQYLDCKLSDNSKWYYTDASGVNTLSASPLNANLDQGQFFAVTYSGSSNTSVGEIYALYDVELTDPQPSGASVFQAIGNAASISTVLPSNAPVFHGSNTATSQQFVFGSPGRYLMVLTALATSAGTIISTGGASVVGERRVNNGTSTIATAVVSVAALPADITFSALTGLTSWTIYITRLPILPNTFV